jgi:hypothetical protein
MHRARCPCVILKMFLLYINIEQNKIKFTSHFIIVIIIIINICSSIAGNYYYRLKGSGSQSQGYVDSGYPRSKSVWNIDSALPTVDAVFKWAVNGRTYMFSGEQYIMFDDINIGVSIKL